MRLYTSAALKLFPVFSHKKAQKAQKKPCVQGVNKFFAGAFTVK